MGKTKKEYHKEHAIHNNEAVKVINKPGKHLDWTITICFYTALHAVKYKAFPLVYKVGKNVIKHESFEDYCNYTRETRGSKHEKICDLLRSHFPDISTEYEQLMQMCWTARYRNYVVDRDESNFAISLKDHIYEFCMDKDIDAPDAPVAKAS